jgi:hypothetical protein
VALRFDVCADEPGYYFYQWWGVRSAQITFQFGNSGTTKICWARFVCGPHPSQTAKDGDSPCTGEPKASDKRV